MGRFSWKNHVFFPNGENYEKKITTFHKGNFAKFRIHEKNTTFRPLNTKCSNNWFPCIGTNSLFRYKIQTLGKIFIYLKALPEIYFIPDIYIPEKSIAKTFTWNIYRRCLYLKAIILILILILAFWTLRSRTHRIIDDRCPDRIKKSKFHLHCKRFFFLF